MDLLICVCYYLQAAENNDSYIIERGILWSGQ